MNKARGQKQGVSVPGLSFWQEQISLKHSHFPADSVCNAVQLRAPGDPFIVKSRPTWKRH